MSGESNKTMSEKLIDAIEPESYHYVAVKGSPFSTDSTVFGMTDEEALALGKRYPDSRADVLNGLMVKGAPMNVINSLAELGYRVICCTGDADVLWTLQRES